MEAARPRCLFPGILLASLGTFLPVARNARRKQVPSPTARRAPSPATGVKLFSSKHKHQPLTCFKKRSSWMSAEPKQTKWGGREGKAIGPIRLEQRARVTLPLPVSVVGVCCCVNYSSSRSRRREQPSWNRFKWNVPPGSKQLPSCPAGRDSTPPRRAGLRTRPAGLCARVLRG